MRELTAMAACLGGVFMIVCGLAYVMDKTLRTDALKSIAIGLVLIGSAAYIL